MTSRLSSGARLVKRAKHEVEQEKHELIPGSDVSTLPLILYNRQQGQRNSSFLQIFMQFLSLRTAEAFPVVASLPPKSDRVSHLPAQAREERPGGAFHLVKISGISGSAVNGTRFVGSFHWKIPRKSGKSKKVVPFSRLEFPNGMSCSIYVSCSLYQGLRPNGTTFYQSEIPLLLPPKFPGFFRKWKAPPVSPLSLGREDERPWERG